MIQSQSSVVKIGIYCAYSLAQKVLLMNNIQNLFRDLFYQKITLMMNQI